MSHPFQLWQTDQLGKIGAKNPERMSELLEPVWQRYPALMEELAIRAVNEGQITKSKASELLSLSIEAIEEKLDHFQHSGDHRIDFENGVAKLVSCKIAVWEVAREFSKQGSIEALQKSYPAIPVSDLKAALRYAEGNEKEIAEAIARYERLYDQKYVV